MSAKCLLFTLFLTIVATAPVAAKTSTKHMTFESASFEIRCEGGECDWKYIRDHLKKLERSLREFREVLHQECREKQHKPLASEKTYVVVHVVDDAEFLRTFSETNPDIDLGNSLYLSEKITEDTLFFNTSDDEVYMRQVIKKENLSFGSVWVGYARILYRRAFGDLPTPATMSELSRQTRIRLKNIVALEDLRK